MDEQGATTSARDDGCYGGGSLAGAVIGTFLTTILLFAVAGLVYRQWRRHKGKHLVLVTNPEIVEDAYAFDNPCFKDAATPAVGRNHDDSRPLSTTSPISEASPIIKASNGWSGPWSSLGLASVNKNDKRRTLDDSCLGSKATKVSFVSLRSRDFTGLGFNVCGNMREGIFVKDLLHRGPASESGRINPGDRIGSVKISFRSMVYEDALTILSYASPYDVELEVESGGGVSGGGGGSGAFSRPATLLKKTVGPSPSRICHPLYRSQSIPELSRAHKTSAKRLFAADPNESTSSNCFTVNSTIKLTKSTTDGHTSDRRHDDAKSQNHHHHHQHHQKFGIKVLPALDGTVTRIENQNEHNTNLERRNSRKLDMDDEASSEYSMRKIANENSSRNKKGEFDDGTTTATVERYQKRENLKRSTFAGSIVRSSGNEATDATDVSRESEAGKHRKNINDSSNPRRSTFTDESNDLKSPQRNKRKAPAPPPSVSSGNGIETSRSIDQTLAGRKDAERNYGNEGEANDDDNDGNSIKSINDYAESLYDYASKIRDGNIEKYSSLKRSSKRRKPESDSDNDSEIPDSSTTIELKPTDITIHHHGPMPSTIDDDDDDDDIYRKAASLGDLSKYENKNSATLERAQSLDMADAGSKKRKMVGSHDEANRVYESTTEDATRIEDTADTLDGRKLKKSNEWGTLEDAIWKNPTMRVCKRSNDNEERSRSTTDASFNEKDESSENGRCLAPICDDDDDDTSIELYNLPLSIELTAEFIRAERTFDPDEDNSLARIVNNGRIVKSPTPEETELNFTRTTSDWSPRDEPQRTRISDLGTTKLEIWKDSLYLGKEEVNEEPARKVTVATGCPSCDRKWHRDHTCTDKNNRDIVDSKSREVMKLPENNDDDDDDDATTLFSASKIGPTRFEKKNWSDARLKSVSPTESRIEKKLSKEREGGVVTVVEIGDDRSPTRRKIDLEKRRDATRGILNEEEGEEEEGYDFGSGITVNSESTTSPMLDRRNVSNVSVSSGENSEDSGLVGESGDYPRHCRDTEPSLLDPPSCVSQQNLTYVTEISVSTGKENLAGERARKKATATDPPLNGKSGTGSAVKKPPVPPRRNDAAKISPSTIGESEATNNDSLVGKNGNENARMTAKASIRLTDHLDGASGVKKFENWIYLGDRAEENSWGNGSPGQQRPPVGNIVVTAARDDENIVHR